MFSWGMQMGACGLRLASACVDQLGLLPAASRVQAFPGSLADWSGLCSWYSPPLITGLCRIDLLIVRQMIRSANRMGLGKLLR